MNFICNGKDYILRIRKWDEKNNCWSSDISNDIFSDYVDGQEIEIFELEGISDYLDENGYRNNNYDIVLEVDGLIYFI